MIPVNLAHQRMGPPDIAIVSQVSAVAGSNVYREAAGKLGLTHAQYEQVLERLRDGDVEYGVLPQRIDAMAGKVHGRARIWTHVLVPRQTMGWTIKLIGANVYVPRECGNLSLNHVSTPHAKPNVSYRGYYTPVVFAPIVPVPEAAVTWVGFVPSVPVAPAAPVAVVHRNPLPFFSLLFPILAGLTGGGSGGHDTPPIAPCSLGSNETGVCR